MRRKGIARKMGRHVFFDVTNPLNVQLILVGVGGIEPPTN